VISKILDEKKKKSESISLEEVEGEISEGEVVEVPAITTTLFPSPLTLSKPPSRSSSESTKKEPSKTLSRSSSAGAALVSKGKEMQNLLSIKETEEDSDDEEPLAAKLKQPKVVLNILGDEFPDAVKGNKQFEALVTAWVNFYRETFNNPDQDWSERDRLRLFTISAGPHHVILDSVNLKNVEENKNEVFVVTDVVLCHAWGLISVKLKSGMTINEVQAIHPGAAEFVKEFYGVGMTFNQYKEWRKTHTPRTHQKVIDSMKGALKHSSKESSEKATFDEMEVQRFNLQGSMEFKSQRILTGPDTIASLKTPGPSTKRPLSQAEMDEAERKKQYKAQKKAEEEEEEALKAAKLASLKERKQTLRKELEKRRKLKKKRSKKSKKESSSSETSTESEELSTESEEEEVRIRKKSAGRPSTSVEVSKEEADLALATTQQGKF